MQAQKNIHYESLQFPSRFATAGGMKNSLHEKFAKARKSRGLSMDKLAEKLNTSRGQIYQLEKGKRKLTEDWMQRIADALGYDLVDIISDDMEAEKQIKEFVHIVRGFSEHQRKEALQFVHFLSEKK